jgi:uncharacterized protein (DUF58 family)
MFSTRIKPGEPPPEVALEMAHLIALRAEAEGLTLNRGKVLAGHNGGYTSAFLGRGMEFSETRRYQPGDDVRTIDWRVTARTGKPHTKLFQEERERPIILALDYRRPMFFATRGVFKAVQASRLAALLAWRALKEGDRVGGFIFSEELHREFRPQLGSRAVLGLFRHMVEDPAWVRAPHKPFIAQSRLSQTVMRLRRVARPGSLVLILSDFNQWDSRVEKELTLLSRHNEVALINLFDPLEADLPPAGAYRITDGKEDLTMETRGSSTRQSYQERFLNHLNNIAQFCTRNALLNINLSTEDSPLEALRVGLLGVKRGKS